MKRQLTGPGQWDNTFVTPQYSSPEGHILNTFTGGEVLTFQVLVR